MPDADLAARYGAFDLGADACRNGTWVTACPLDGRLADAWTAGWTAEHALQNHGPATTGWLGDALARFTRAGLRRG